MIAVGERINGMFKDVKRAIKKKLQSGRQRHDPFKKQDLKTLLDKVEALSKTISQGLVWC